MAKWLTRKLIRKFPLNFAFFFKKLKPCIFIIKAPAHKARKRIKRETWELQKV